MKNLLLVLFLFTFNFSLLTLFAQPTEPILRLNTEMHTARNMRISTDAAGKYMLTVSEDKTAKLWSATTGDLIKTFRVPIGSGHYGSLFAGAISPNGTMVAVGGYTGAPEQAENIYIFNRSTGELLQRLGGLGNVINDIEFSPDGTFLAAALGSGGVVIYKNASSGVGKGAAYLVAHKTLSGYGNSSYNIVFDHTGRLATVCWDGKIRLYDKEFNLTKKTTGAGKQPFSIAFSPDGKKLAVGYNDAAEVEVFSGQNLKLLYKPQLDGMNTNGGFGAALAFSADGTYLVGGGGYLKVIDGKFWCVIRKWTNAGQGTYTDYPACTNIVADIKTLTNNEMLFGGSYPDFGRMDQYGVKAFYKTGEVNAYNANDRSHFKLNPAANILAFTPSGKEALQFSVADRTLTGFKTQSGLESYTDKSSGLVVTDWKNTFAPKINGTKLNFIQQNERCRSTDIAADGSRIVFGTNWNIYCTDAKGNKLWAATVQGTAWAVNISGNGKIVAAAQNGGVINWYSMKNGELLLTLFPHPDNKRWLLYTPDGYFDCSPGAENLAGWHVNQGADNAAKFYPMSQFYEQFYTPNLGARILAGEKITSSVKMNDFKLPPLVEILSQEVTTRVNKKEFTVKVKITDQGGGIDEIRLYHNDKLVETTQRGFKLVEKKNEENTKTFNILLSDGNNLIKATAFNNQRTESLPAEITVFYEGVKTTSNLYVLVLGVDKYKNPKYNLNYAVADASAFKTAIEKGSSDIFGKVNVTFLQDANASRANILQEFAKLKSTAKQEDVFIFYYAGHGVMSEEDKSQFYIVPYDVTQLYGNNELLQSKAISASELQTFSTELKAQKQMFVFDACQSGGMTELLASRGAAEEKAIAQLARSTGTYWLAASNSEQFATEFAELGHGLFTYSILLGLQGQADGGSKDKKITIKELSAFLNDKVPELSEKHKGSAQYPTSYGYGQDFPIIIVK